MAYVSPTTRTTGDVVTAAIWNQDAVDNVKFLHDPPSCRVYHSTLIAVPNTTATALSFNSERFDTDTMHSTASNTSRITFKTAGKYLVGGNALWAANATGTRILSIRLNGTTTIAGDGRANLGGSTTVDHAMPSTLYQFAVNDYVELVAYQDSGGSLNINASANYSPEFWAVWVSG